MSEQDLADQILMPFHEDGTTSVIGELNVLARWHAGDSGAATPPPAESLKGLLSHPREEWPSRILTFLQWEIASAAGITPHVVDPETSIVALGIDSLSAVRIGHAFQAATGLAPSSELFFEDCSLRTTANTLADTLLLTTLSDLHDETVVLQTLEKFSDEEIERLLSYIQKME